MKRTIAVKRAELLREWLFAVYANDGNYYQSTLMLGIPDGDDLEMVLEDLQDGWYDNDIDEMLEVYIKARERYGKNGYYYNNHVYHSGYDCLDAAGYVLPQRITKTGEYHIYMGSK